MLVAIVRIKQDNYYLNFDICGDSLTYNVILANNKETRNLKEDEVKKLLEVITSGNKVFKENKDGYDIYIDELGNKRFFIDGKEDFIKFFQNNGRSALLYKKNNEEEEFLLKRFTLSTKETISVFIIASMLPFVVSSAYDNTIGKIHYEDNRVFIEKRLDTSDVYEFINESEGSITEKQKQYLYNEEFIGDVLEIADDSRNYILRKKIENIHVTYGGEGFADGRPLGFYSPLEFNCIHLIDDSEEIFSSTLAHEFVHLMQDNNEYVYIREASAEMMAEEYYNSPAYTYPKQRSNLKLLFEMIGPQPIRELNFKGDTTAFEDAIRKNLDEEEADRLLELFQASPSDTENIDDIDQEVRKLLDTMSYNMTGMTLSDPNNAIGRASILRETYFNKHLPSYYESYEFNAGSHEIIGDLEIQSIDFSNLVECKVRITEYISEEEYDKLERLKTNEYEVNKKEEFTIPGKWVRTDPTIGYFYEFNNEVISEEEARKRGYIKNTYTKITEKELYDYNVIKKEVKPGNEVAVNMSFTDGTMGFFSLKEGKNERMCTHYKPSKKRLIPSLAEQFPETSTNQSKIKQILNIFTDQDGKEIENEEKASKHL